MKPHKHAVLIKAWADGQAEVEYRYPKDDGSLSLWKDLTQCVFHDWYEYRIKPEPKPDIVKSFILEANPILGLRLNEISGFQKQPHEDWIRIVFDGETTKMKSAEVVK